MYEKSTQERLEFLEDRLARLEQLVKISFQGVADELDNVEETSFEHEKTIKEFTKVLDVHFDLIKQLARQNE